MEPARRYELLAWARRQRWFYPYAFPDGWTAEVHPSLSALHEARRLALRRVLAERFGERLAGVRALDLSCHQGFFSFDLAEQVREVEGVDVNAESLEAARVVAELRGVGNVAFRQADLTRAEPADLAPADFVLLYGLLYHVEDPLRLLRLAAALATDTLLIETQVLSLDIDARIEWGAADSFRQVRGLFALVDDQGNPEGGVTDLALVPSPQALRTALLGFGFARVEFVQAPPGAEQLDRGSRAIVAAYR